MSDAEAVATHAETCDGTRTLSGTGQCVCSCGWRTEPFFGRADAQYFVLTRPPAPVPIPDDAVIPEWKVGSQPRWEVWWPTRGGHKRIGRHRFRVAARVHAWWRYAEVWEAEDA